MGKSTDVTTPPIFTPSSNNYVSPYDYTPAVPAVPEIPELPGVNDNGMSDLLNQNHELMASFERAMTAMAEPTIISSGAPQIGTQGKMQARGLQEVTDFNEANAAYEKTKFSVADTIVTSPLEDPANQKRLKAILG